MHPRNPAPGQRSQDTPREFNRLVPPLPDTRVGSTNFVFRTDRPTESRCPISNFGESIHGFTSRILPSSRDKVWECQDKRHIVMSRKWEGMIIFTD